MQSTLSTNFGAGFHLPEYPLIFIRHGQTRWNVERRIQGSTDIPLNDRGIEQARSQGDCLKSLGIAHQEWDFWCSPLQRTSYTANLVASAIAYDVDHIQQSPYLMELGLGVWEGMSMRDVQKTYADQYGMRRQDLAHYAPPEGESYNMVLQRLVIFFRGVERPSIIVTHCGVMRSIIAAMLCKRLDVMERYHVSQERPLIWDGKGFLSKNDLSDKEFFRANRW